MPLLAVHTLQFSVLSRHHGHKQYNPIAEMILSRRPASTGSTIVLLTVTLAITTRRIRPCGAFLMSSNAVRFSTRQLDFPQEGQISEIDNGSSDESWSQEQYLQFHQTIGKRKTFRRMLEITSVLSGKIFRPLVCSLVREPQLMLNQNDWEEFWKRQSRSMSNAERVAKGLPTLGPTFVKLGQVAATRPDILNVPLAEALANLQDRVAPFDNFTAKRIIRRELKQTLQNNGRNRFINNDEDLTKFLGSLSSEPVASASISQVYKGQLPGFGTVAVKVQRPGIRKTVERDATFLHTVATFIQDIHWPKWTPIEDLRGEPIFGSSKIVEAVDEFTARVLEEMDFEKEADNMKLFADLYHYKRGESRDVQVVVPELIQELSSRRVIIMEWMEGTKLTDICLNCDDRQSVIDENLALIRKAIEMTLSQLLTTGILHSDPHTGNLLKITTPEGKTELGYLDFGLVSSVPQRFQDGIVCATCQLVFARNIEAVADLCVDLGLLSEEKLKDDRERKTFIDALEAALDEALIWPKDSRGRSTEVPRIRFDRALAAASKLIANFEFTIPPYFLSNARAIATLEGIALKLDPSFNIVQVIYPYSINHLMTHPDVSRTSEETFLSICRSPKTRLFDHGRFMKLLQDWSLLTGYPKRKIYWDLITSIGTRRVMSRIFKESIMKRFRGIKYLITKSIGIFKRKELLQEYELVANY